eukprot:CAMPEP_0172453366 /NCGR_PEP_ID=MMETSP1065-20121228/10716_1 /TAXON_ID=265537 /ORGANISM="Amphiprora paludosa, Strain CCMP125" /LENGTH=558 /DNA_ID=CAMNT_0013205545 /DNA_START=18 /DNA_END=1694 /DNA_ORIENTATION=-
MAPSRLMRTSDGRAVKKEKRRPPRTTPKKWHATHDTTSLGSGDSSAATPTSVVLGAPSVLTRELSDLSGSYLNGNTIPRVQSGSSEAQSAYQSDQSATSYQRAWRLGKILSSREPAHPQPPQDCNDSIGVFKEQLFDGPQGLEIVPHCGDSLDTGVDTGDSSTNHERQPIVILLMDPGRKMYELMQLWVDLSADSVRDVLHAVQLALSNRWRQDYDGLFQARNNSFSQLIHILDISKYDVRPMEIWVAKPWAMPAKATISYASRALQHLQNLKVVSQIDPNDSDNVRLTPSRKSDETILVLSKEARTRSYVPGGILKHHHAHQFLSFSPSFEPSVRVDVLADDDVASQLSDSQVGTSFASGSHDETSEDPFAAVPVTPHDSSGLNNGHEVVKMRLSKYPTPTKPAPKSAMKSSSSSPKRYVPEPTTPATEIESSPPPKTPPTKQSKPISIKEPALKRKPSERAPDAEPQGLAKFFSALNCTKNCASGGRPRRDPGPTSMPSSPLDTMETMRESVAGNGELWKVWEDEASLRSQSVVSASRPLLRSREKSQSTARSDWL